MSNCRYDNLVAPVATEFAVSQAACKALDKLERLKRFGEKHEADVVAMGDFVAALTFLERENGRHTVRELLRQNLLSRTRQRGPLPSKDSV